jgi:hypothetical protein
VDPFLGSEDVEGIYMDTTGEYEHKILKFLIAISNWFLSKVESL